MDVDKVFTMLSSLWKAELPNEEGIKVSDMGLDLLEKLLITADYHKDPAKFFSVFDKSAEIVAHVDPEGALPRLMGYLQRYKGLDVCTLCSCTRWVDHITGFNGTKYPDGSRILLNLLAENLSHSDNADLRLATSVYTIRTLLRWKHPNLEIFDAISTHSEAADMIYNSLGAAPPIPRRYLDDDFYAKAIELLATANGDRATEIEEMYQGKRSFVL